MILNQFSFTENPGQDQEWSLDDLPLKTSNLLVGKNATGKSRTLDAISSLAKLLSAQILPDQLSVRYSASFSEGGDFCSYRLSLQGGKVEEEELSLNGKVHLERRAGFPGKIFDADGPGKFIRFQPPENELAVVVRRDAIQHPFLLPLHEWSISLRHYRFGTSLGKDHLAMFVEKGGRPITVADDRDPAEIVGVFVRALYELGEPFKKAILDDLGKMEYPADDVDVGPPINSSHKKINDQPGEIRCLWIKESGLKARTDQSNMSQGMFRVLSILILINYLTLKNSAACILIDDIGEGLDFERSCSLIDLLREKAMKSSIQLIVATNDRFVMNKVPLEEWTVLQRQGSHLKCKNYQNSTRIFDAFKMMGLNNFDFLRYNFIDEDPESLFNERAEDSECGLGLKGADQ